MNESKYAWRPATKADIGSIARFGNKNGHFWQYGLLASVSRKTKTLSYQCSSSAGFEDWEVCEIQSKDEKKR